MITLVVEQLRDTGRIRLNGTKDEWAEFAAEFDHIYREKIAVKETPDKDDKTLYGAEYVWKRNGHDDYVHALLYAIVGLQKYGGELAKIIGGEDIWKGIAKGRMVEPQIDPSPIGVVLGERVEL